jgi:hypothetical protein
MRREGDYRPPSVGLVSQDMAKGSRQAGPQGSSDGFSRPTLSVMMTRPSATPADARCICDRCALKLIGA